MQRDKYEYPMVRKYKSILFWQECRFCHKEFRREYGFEIKDYKKCRASNETPIYTSYCCSKCAESIDNVRGKIEQNNIDFRKMRPSKPVNNK